MLETSVFRPGNYRYIHGPFQYSGGVAAESGYVIERARFDSPISVSQGFDRIKAHLESLGRPLTSLCACELRSPAPFSEDGFIEFNRIYVGTLKQWGICREEDNPVARSNVCPVIAPPVEPGIESFSYTVSREHLDYECPSNNFVISGGAEAEEGPGSYQDRIVSLGDTSNEGMRKKASFVLNSMENRMQALDQDWSNSTATQVYTVHNFFSFLAEEIVARGATPHGLTVHYAHPPVEGLEYEMDVRSIAREKTLTAAISLS